MNNDPSASRISITREEACSQHVDELLKRQMSLRGEPGIAREPGRAWYLQSWLLLSVTGLVCSLGAWFLLEPYMHDYYRVQAVIEEVHLFDAPQFSITTRGRDMVLKHPVVARVKAAGRDFWVLEGVREVEHNAIGPYLPATALIQGAELALYISSQTPDVTDLPLVWLVDAHPPPAAKEGPDLLLQEAHGRTASLLFFAVTAGLVGLGVGAVDGIVCRLPRRALFCGVVGLVLGFVGGFLSSILANIIYAPVSDYAQSQMEGGGWQQSIGFGLQMLGRMLAWGLAGSAMGVGQGLALRSSRLMIYGLVGGIVGGLLGGMFFDPIESMVQGGRSIGAGLSRGVGLAAIGLCVGGMIGVVELFARDAWLRMVQGPLKGKEFLLFKDVMRVGASPKSDLYLFNDTRVAQQHAIIRAVGDDYELEACQAANPVIINGAARKRARLRHGDDITIGNTVFTFQKRKG